MHSPNVRLAERQDSGPGSRRSDPGTSPAIEAIGLTKIFRSNWSLRTTVALDGLDLEVPRGEIFGLLGPNGAGKTTTLKLLTGLLKPTRGMAWLLGESIHHHASRRRVGFLPEQPYLQGNVNGLEHLELCGRLAGLHGQEARTRARYWLGRVGLGDRAHLWLRKYSKGMQQRLGLAAALIHEPELVILDEPMSGLDPFGRRDVRELVLEQRERGATVVFSSHILPDVEMLCDRVGIVIGGRLVRTATVGDLVSQGHQRVEIRCVGKPLLEVPPVWRERLTRLEHPEGTVFMLSDGTHLDAVVAWLLRSGVGLRAVTPQRHTLEELFLEAARQPLADAGVDARAAEGAR